MNFQEINQTYTQIYDFKEHQNTELQYFNLFLTSICF